MDEKDVSGSIMVISEDNTDSLCPMFFGVSCAFFALRLLPEPETCDNKWSEIWTRMLKGSAHLLGLLVWRVQREGFINGRFDLLQKLECAEKQIVELKKRRSEEAKANEKVVSIFAAREQGWLDERRQLRQHINALMNDSRVLAMKKDESISELSRNLEESLVALQLKDRVIEEIEEKLKKAENLVEEFRAHAEVETERHSFEASKQKTAFVELVSSHRQLEAETGYALRQAEAAKQELDLMMEHKEQVMMVNQMLSIDLVKMCKDSEHKDRILTALLRKLKLNSSEKQVLLQEIRSTKVKGKQSKVEIERFKAVYQHKDRHLCRNMLPKLSHENIDVSEKFRSPETELHHANFDSFTDQLRLKDEKLEAFRWNMMKMELESKRFQSHIKGLDREIARLRQDNMKLEAILLECDAELHTLKQQLLLHRSCQLNDDTVCLKGKVFRRKLGHRRQESKVDEKVTMDLPVEEIKEANIVSPHRTINAKSNDTRASTGLDLHKRSNSTSKMDIYSLGVSYKIKRLKQQLIILERQLVEMTSSSDSCISSLNKQVDRYQLLQRRIDDLCKRMQHKNELDLSYGGSSISKQEDETRRLEQFLEETFQLQRYIVATGQKLMEVQGKIGSGFGGLLEGEMGGNMEMKMKMKMKQFGESIEVLVREVQRGLEVQLSRIMVSVHYKISEEY